ncbi:hypothetical protein [Deinococcus gobiensis]|uniref:PKD domain-containing protein n=1 Tax=Deinococcus gobiensis (strain DSM 21396 / JCM 16679 / CGMCC 1.7299 / I-0) TaxID=745776 RepID=H8H207_DEIGI|nr:hypothetical protein [Deinococcus gobiensis]AFD27554.1 hypothetical protein DGo_PB0285 [Deinococcus gobiensis I-0]
MKITAPLLLLPLLLAACGTQSVTPVASTPSTATTSVTDIAAFEAGVQRDLAALGLTSTLSGQAVTPKSYLNVLKVSDTTARAYMKTTYPAATGCALDWGDGTAMSTITTPSVVATDKAEHTYNRSGTYTVKLTCGTDVKLMSFTALITQTDLNLMEDYTGFANNTNSTAANRLEDSYVTKGFKFTSTITYASKGLGNPPGHIGILLNTMEDEFARIETSNGTLFNIYSMTANAIFKDRGDIKIVAYDKNGGEIGNYTYYYGNATKYTLNWENVKYIEAHLKNYAGGNNYLNIDDMSVATLKP